MARPKTIEHVQFTAMLLGFCTKFVFLGVAVMIERKLLEPRKVGFYNENLQLIHPFHLFRVALNQTHHGIPPHQSESDCQSWDWRSCPRRMDATRTMYTIQYIQSYCIHVTEYIIYTYIYIIIYSIHIIFIYIYTVIRLYVNNHEHVRSKTKYSLTNLNGGDHQPHCGCLIEKNNAIGKPSENHPKPSENHPKPPVHHRFEQRKRFHWPSRAKIFLEFGHDFLPLQTLSKHLKKQPLPSCKTSWGSGSAGQRLIPSPIRLQRKRHCPRQEALSDYPELHFLHTGGLRGFSCHWLFIVETVVNTWTKYILQRQQSTRV